MPITSQFPLENLRQQVQYNCHLSDALHGRNYSLCIYLLKMREFYRWEQGLGFAEPIPKGPLGEWLSERERLWESIEDQDYQGLQIRGQDYLAFDTPAINQELLGHGLLYSGGLCGNKPHFFLAELEQQREEQGIAVYLAGRELARELTAPPALSLGRRIYLRRESLRRMLWEKLEEWGWQDPQRAIARAVSLLPFASDRDRGLEAMTEMEIPTLLAHEIGEVLLGDELGPDWEAMLSALPHSRAEIQLRAIRDHLVDCRYTLSALLEPDRQASLHFYMANLGGMRKALFPKLVQAYQAWLDGDGGRQLREAISRGAEHWQALAEQALVHYRRDGEDSRSLQQALQRSEEALVF